MHQRIDWRRLAVHVLKERTTYQLGREIGLSQAAVSRLAAGKTQQIGAQQGVALIKLAGGQVVVPDFAVRTDVCHG